MKTYKLSFDETVEYRHEIIIKTNLSENELEELLDEIDFSDSNLEDAAYLLEKESDENIIVEELIENDPNDWGMECTDYNQIKNEEK